MPILTTWYVDFKVKDSRSGSLFANPNIDALCLFANVSISLHFTMTLNVGIQGQPLRTRKITITCSLGSGNPTVIIQEFYLTCMTLKNQGQTSFCMTFLISGCKH